MTFSPEFIIALRRRTAPTIHGYIQYEETNFSHRFGIDKLLVDGIYSAAYPLHQGIRGLLPEDVTKMNNAEILRSKWASWRAWCKEQPLDLIKRYFGSQIGIYFAWLGYYTTLLVPAAILGLLSLIFGFATVGGHAPT